MVLQHNYNLIFFILQIFVVHIAKKNELNLVIFRKKNECQIFFDN